MPKVTEESITNAIYQILVAAEDAGWSLSRTKSLTSGTLIFANQAAIGTAQERDSVVEAFDRMLNELNWIRQSESGTFKVSQQGRQALNEWRTRTAFHRLERVQEAMLHILSQAIGAGSEIYWCRDPLKIGIWEPVQSIVTESFDLSICNEACKEMLHDDGWIKHFDGLRYAVTARGKKAFIDAVVQKDAPAGEIVALKAVDTRKVFIVHGHDELAKREAATVVYQLQLEPVILHEQINSGMTIIEKFEKHADVGFAIVLLTPDDLGYSAEEAIRSAAGGRAPLARSRARQNVIMELGYFVGRLGRSKVCALHKNSVELPSDIQGIVYTPMDEAGKWRHDLAREILAAGFEVDVSRVS